MGRDDFIGNRNDVIKNINTLYSYLDSGSDDEIYQWATSRMKNGKMYVVEIIDSHICFGPSRFIGYKDKTIEEHQKDHGNGNQTNDALKKCYQKVEDERLDKLFQKVLARYDLFASNKKILDSPRYDNRRYS